jgi:exopolysaccharide biosynthesis protein
VFVFPLIAAAAFAQAHAAEPIIVAPVEFTTSDGTVRGHLATIDLRSDRVEVVVTNPLDKPDPDAKADSVLTPTNTWAAQHGLALAINANFFGVLPTDAKPKGYTANARADIMGLSISDGVLISPARVVGTDADPALLFAKDRRATITRATPDLAKDAWDAVAGIGKGSDHLAGTLLIEQGVRKADSARVDPAKRHPRTAAGVSADGWTLTLLVLDGRQKDWSVGATLPEVAQYLLDRGVTNALALDGGGSSSFYHDPDPTKPNDETTNKPSDKSFRPVANHLGFKLKPAPDKNATADNNPPQSPNQNPK